MIRIIIEINQDKVNVMTIGPERAKKSDAHNLIHAISLKKKQLTEIKDPGPVIKKKVKPGFVFGTTEKICKYCGNSFKARSNGQKFCSDICKAAQKLKDSEKQPIGSGLNDRVEKESLKDDPVTTEHKGEIIKEEVFKITPEEIERSQSHPFEQP